MIGSVDTGNIPRIDRPRTTEPGDASPTDARHPPDQERPPGRGLTSVEARVDRAATRILVRFPASGWRAGAVTFAVFGLKQAWACIFGAALLLVFAAARLWYPDDAALARTDALVLAAMAIQATMLLTRLETVRELRVILLFHLVGTVMELFKTAAGSWGYPPDGVLRIADVPLYSGFMYAAVGSYMVRVYRLFDLRFDRYPARWVTAVAGAAVYANFFTHHWIVDLRWVLVAAVIAVFGPCVMSYRVLYSRHRMPLLLAFFLVAVFIWLAENVATWAGAWLYPTQAAGWEPVGVAKLGSWFLLMIISVILVAWLYPPLPAGTDDAQPGTTTCSAPMRPIRSVPHAPRDSNAALSEAPSSVSEYSTRGGTSA